MGHGHGAVVAAGAADADDQNGFALLAVQRQQEGDHFLQLGHELVGLAEGEHEVPDLLVQAGFVFQLRHIVGVGHEPHVEHQVRLDGDAVLEAEGQDADVEPAPVRRGAEQVQHLTAELGRGQGGGVQHEIRVIPHRLHQRPFPPYSLLHAEALGLQGVHTPGLLIAVDDGGGVRLQKQHPAVDAAGLQLLQGVDEHIRGLAGAHVIHQGHPVIPPAGGGAEPGELHHHLRRKIVHGIVADVLQKRGGLAFAAAGQTGYDQNFHCISSFPGVIRRRNGPPAPAGRRGPCKRPPAPGGSAPARRRRWRCRC